MNQVVELISILVPTRERPENIKRLMSSLELNTELPNSTEVLFYVDDDDLTFPQIESSIAFRLITGPKLWLSIMQNILYSHAKGQILMYAGDDITFETPKWDMIVRSRFLETDDRIRLVFGNDLGWYGDRIALHGFVHRNWIETTGVWVAPGRMSCYDLWFTDVARKLGRLDYVENLHTPHLHYRQGEGQADYDSVYHKANSSMRSWKPLITYKKLERERRIDRILLAEKMHPKPPLEKKYYLGEKISRLHFISARSGVDLRRLKTLSNFEILPLLAVNALRVLFRKRSFSH
jgi:hypothetical protein